MPYKLSNTSFRVSNFAPVRNCCFARLIDCINFLFDTIFKVSLILFQSLMLTTTDSGFPSGVVIYSTFGSSRAFNTGRPSLSGTLFFCSKGSFAVDPAHYAAAMKLILIRYCLILKRPASRLIKEYPIISGGLTMRNKSVLFSLKLNFFEGGFKIKKMRGILNGVKAESVLNP